MTVNQKGRGLLEREELDRNAENVFSWKLPRIERTKLVKFPSSKCPVWLRPIEPIAEWAYSARLIAGLRSFANEARTVLEKGIGPDGLAIRLPMPTYHLSPDDAQAVIAYLRSKSWRK